MWRTSRYCPKNETEQNHETLCTAGLLVLPSMKRGNHRTALQWLSLPTLCGATPTNYVLPAATCLSSGRLATGASCSEFEKSRDTKKLAQHVNGSLSASLFTYIPFLFFFSVLHFLFICLSVVYHVRHAGLGPKTGFPNRFFVFFSAVPRRWNHSICM